mgnify:CR=1 FL=1
MATEAHKFQVGVFVIATSIIGVGALIWLGASRYFERTEAFVTYFNESVQGLDPGASVKYRGVPGGRVASISVAPDNELIEVRMDIDPKIAEAIKNDRDLRATLELSGITGLRYVEIERKTGAALEQSPYLHFKAPATVILSSRSSFKAVQRLDRTAVNLQGLSDELRTQPSRLLFSDPPPDRATSGRGDR